MKFFRRGIILCIPVLTLFACEPPLPEVTPEEGELVAQIAEPVTAELLRTLVGRLAAALEEGGPGQAMELCSTEAMPLTRAIEGGLQNGFSLKRTSFRYRNPLNAPDQAEEAALSFFEEAIVEGGVAPSSFVQRVSEEEIRYYRPLFVGEVCLTCHGARESMDPEVLEVLAEQYPSDLATGYQAGAFRGVVRVSVPAEALAGREP